LFDAVDALQERRIALSEGRPVPQDLLGILLTAADESGQAMTDEELWEDVHDVMGAGVSTPFVLPLFFYVLPVHNVCFRISQTCV
jgi:cytochrome P450